MDKWDEQTVKGWNDLAFYYEYNADLKQWRFYGSNSGLQKLGDLIRNYASNQSNGEISDHLHLGPHQYLKIMTWKEAAITENYIAGSLEDLLRLSELIYQKIKSTKIGEISKVSVEYSQQSNSSLLIFVMADDFIPSFIEFN